MGIFNHTYSGALGPQVVTWLCCHNST